MKIVEIGICVDTADGKSSCIVKTKGRVSDLYEVIKSANTSEGKFENYGSKIKDYIIYQCCKI